MNLSTTKCMISLLVLCKAQAYLKPSKLNRHMSIGKGIGMDSTFSKPFKENVAVIR